MFAWLRGAFTWIAGKLCGPPSMSFTRTRERLGSLSPGDYVTVYLHESSGSHLFEGFVTEDTSIGVKGNAVVMDRVQDFQSKEYRSFSFPLRAVHFIHVSHGPHDR